MFLLLKYLLETLGGSKQPQKRSFRANLHPGKGFHEGWRVPSRHVVTPSIPAILSPHDASGSRAQIRQFRCTRAICQCLG